MLPRCSHTPPRGGGGVASEGPAACDLAFALTPSQKRPRWPASPRPSVRSLPARQYLDPFGARHDRRRGDPEKQAGLDDPRYAMQHAVQGLGIRDRAEGAIEDHVAGFGEEG